MSEGTDIWFHVNNSWGCAIIMLPIAIYWGYTVSFLYSSAPQSHLPCEGLRVYMFVHTLINFAPNDPKFNVACIDVIWLLH